MVRPQLPHALYTAAQVRRLDRLAIGTYELPGRTLMERAGAAALRALSGRWPDAERVLVCCGAGNNAGDGYVLARLAVEAGLAVRVVAVGDPEKLAGDARACFEACPADVESFSGELPRAADVIVDALVGTGLDRPLAGDWRACVEAMNAHPAPVLALDIPSGLHADSGAILGAAVRAQATVSFIALKRGCFTGQGPDRCGEIRFDGLGVPARLYAHERSLAQRFTAENLAPLLPPRARTLHKGDCGHVLVIGGDSGYAGALRLAGEAAIRAGAGRVAVATRPAHVAAIVAGCPVLMTHGIYAPDTLDASIARADVIAIGPGLGRGAWGAGLLRQAMKARVPLALDADALFHLAAMQGVRRDDWILTPHPGEAARLLGVTVDAVEADRFAAVAEIARRYGGVAVLKGAGTLVCAGDERITVNASGNPGMASGGMGDVLTGIAAAFVAQGLSLADAARGAVYAHGAAADHAARAGERGLIASDLFAELRGVVNPWQDD